MPYHADIIVAGAGIAGVCAALRLSEDHRVLLINGAPQSASKVAAGLINPFAGTRARPVWHAQEAQDDFEWMLDRAGCAESFVQSGILRPAATRSQAAHYRSSTKIFPDRCCWLSSEAANEQWPDVTARYGMLITSGGWVHVQRFLSAALQQLQSADCHILRHISITSWGESHDGAYVILDSDERLLAQHLVLALGFGYRSFPRLRQLNLHPVKGQVIQTAPVEGLQLRQPVCGQGYLLPGEHGYTLGTTYERGFTHSLPTTAATRAILELTARMVPSIATSQVTHEVAGVRVGVPGTRLPMVGPLGAGIWVFTGLGSKGLLYAPHIARNLPQYLADPSRIPPEVRVH